MRTIASNTRSGFNTEPSLVAESLLWLNDPDNAIQAICGRLDYVPRNWALYFQWGDTEPSLTTTGLEVPATLPREDWRYIFDNNNLRREYIFPFVPAVQPHEILQKGPALRYTRCHWSTPFIGGTIPTSPTTSEVVAIPAIQWFLYYGKNGNENEDFTASQDFNSDPFITDNKVSSLVLRQPLAVDSVILPGGNEFGDTPSYFGWVIVLMKRDIETDIQNPSITRIKYKSYASYHLHEDNKVFQSQKSNKFSIVHNPLNLPEHTLYLRPFFP